MRQVGYYFPPHYHMEPCGRQWMSSTVLLSGRVRGILDTKAVGGLFPHPPWPASVSHEEARRDGATQISCATSLLSCQRSSTEPRHFSSRTAQIFLCSPTHSSLWHSSGVAKMQERASAAHNLHLKEKAALQKVPRESCCLWVSTAKRRNPCRYILSFFPSPLYCKNVGLPNDSPTWATAKAPALWELASKQGLCWSPLNLVRGLFSPTDPASLRFCSWHRKSYYFLVAWCGVVHWCSGPLPSVLYTHLGK